MVLHKKCNKLQVNKNAQTKNTHKILNPTQVARLSLWNNTIDTKYQNARDNHATSYTFNASQTYLSLVFLSADFWSFWWPSYCIREIHTRTCVLQYDTQCVITGTVVYMLKIKYLSCVHKKLVKWMRYNHLLNTQKLQCKSPNSWLLKFVQGKFSILVAS